MEFGSAEVSIYRIYIAIVGYTFFILVISVVYYHVKFYFRYIRRNYLKIPSFGLEGVHVVSIQYLTTCSSEIIQDFIGSFTVNLIFLLQQVFQWMAGSRNRSHYLITLLISVLSSLNLVYCLVSVFYYGYNWCNNSLLGIKSVFDF